MNADPNLKLLVAALLNRMGGGAVLTEDEIDEATQDRKRVTMSRDDEMDGWVVTLEDVDEL